ncbi:MAG: aminoglycoside phosphotransferase family protein [Clostridium sp.]
MSSENGINIQEALEHMAYEGSVITYMRYGHGHINDTFRVYTKAADGEHQYILQRMNKDVFKDPVALMKNIVGVTGFLRDEIIKEGGDPLRETLNVIPSTTGESYYLDSRGDYWRSYLFIDHAICYDAVEKPEDFYQSAKAFGRFQRQLSEYPAEELSETIPNFHNTPVRLDTFRQAVKADVCGRASSVEKEIKFVLDRSDEAGIAMNMLKEGTLPLRVTHNDTKLNNIMIDDTTGEALCIIDLDTIMPGFSIFDFGDSIRFGANTVAEDEPDVSKAGLSLPLFDIYTKGYLEGCKGSLTEAEVKMLPMGAKLMTYECGTRFLTDYLQGDTYFKTTRDNQNLDRCHTQFALVADMEKKWNEMQKIVEKYKTE